MKLWTAAFLTTALFFTSCCPDCRKETTKEVVINNDKNHKPGAHIQINQSNVTAEVEEIFKNDKNNFIIKATILNIEEDAAYPSMAIKGSTYNLIPNFQVDEENIINEDSDKNQKLLALTKLHKGEKFKAIITFEMLKGWYIKDIIP